QGKLVERRDEDDERLASMFTIACDIEPRLERHANIEECDVGLECLHCFACLGAVTTLGDDLHVGMPLEQLVQRAARQCLVVGNEDANHTATGRRASRYVSAV